MQTPNNTPDPLNVNPDDVAVFLHVNMMRQGTIDEIAAAKRVADAMQADPAVRRYVEQLESLMDPTTHPERHPNMN